jgi:hypothetical protein
MSFGGMPLSTLRGMVNGKRGINVVRVGCDNCHYTFQANETGRKGNTVDGQPRVCPKCRKCTANVIED